VKMIVTPGAGREAPECLRLFWRDLNMILPGVSRKNTVQEKRYLTRVWQEDTDQVHPLSTDPGKSTWVTFGILEKRNTTNSKPENRKGGGRKETGQPIRQ